MEKADIRQPFVRIDCHGGLATSVYIDGHDISYCIREVSFKAKGTKADKPEIYLNLDIDLGMYAVEHRHK